MFLPTKPFTEDIEGHKGEPTFRVGRKVPQEAVNLAFYYNPTATDAERVLCADAPRNTIDHRVETKYLYKYGCPDNDNTKFKYFEPYYYFEDEEGYAGYLPLIQVTWYEHKHVFTKYVQQTKTFITDKKNNVENSIYYMENSDGSVIPDPVAGADPTGVYAGYLFLNSTTWEVKSVNTEIIKNESEIPVRNLELQPQQIMPDMYSENIVKNSDIDYMMLNPALNTSSPWPEKLWVYEDGIYDNQNGYGIPLQDNIFDGYTTNAANPLVCKMIEKEPISWEDAGIVGESGLKDGEVTEHGALFLRSNRFSDYDDKTNLKNPLPGCGGFNTEISKKTKYDTEELINDFIDAAEKYCINKTNEHDVKSGTPVEPELDEDTSAWDILQQFSAGKIKADDIVIELVNKDFGTYDSAGKDGEEDHYAGIYMASYIIKLTHHSSATDTGEKAAWAVYANYEGTLYQINEEIRQTPATWEATCIYEGHVDKRWNTYDGMALYKGVITQGEGAGNVNPELSPDILLYPDDSGYLRRILTSIENDTDGNLIEVTKNLYEIEAEHFYITDVFKDGIACFYKHDLLYPIHDYRGPDRNGIYDGDAVAVYTSAMRDLPEGYVYQLKLKASATEKETYILDREVKEREVAINYNASLYTNFISKTTSTYKACYHAFTKEIDRTDEEIYNYPFMFKNVDYFVESVDKYERSSKIKIVNPNIIEDTRAWVNFEYCIVASYKNNGKTAFTSNTREAKILNKEYAVESEYSRFEGRAMIISPKINGNWQSPLDLILDDERDVPSAPVLVSNSDNFVFSCVIITDTDAFKGAINIKCNADGSGLITAETTLDTGFYNPNTGLNTDKLIINNPYLVENGKIYAGYMVKCLDVRHIAVRPPREKNLLDSWYPMLRFGHYSQVQDQYGFHTKICYTMPEYDDQNYSKVYEIPYIDVKKDKAEILNPHMIKVDKYPLLIDDTKTKYGNISVYRDKAGDGLYNLTISSVSFSEGIIMVEEAISENDTILVDYTYLEEYFQYRGFYRNKTDFARIDLNPNMYHTYSDMTYEPSELKPTLNLFNKTLYFFLRPTIRLKGEDVIDKEIIIDSSDSDMLTRLYNNSDILKFNGSGVPEHLTGTLKEAEWANVGGTIQSLKNMEYFTAFLTAEKYKNYTHEFTMSSTDSDDDILASVISAVDDGTGGMHTLSLICCPNNTQGPYLNLPDNSTQFALVFDYCQGSRMKVLAKDSSFTTANVWASYPGGMNIKIDKTENDITISRSEMLSTPNPGSVGSTSIFMTLDAIKDATGIDFTEGTVGYGNYSQIAATFSNIKLEVTSEKTSKHIEWDTKNPLVKNEETLYHTIDEYKPESELDIYIGSVYIRQNTSLYSTILIDTRTRGGGIIESMKDSVRKALEPESDWYLDIGCYDGTPYQENAVIIIRLDNRILKEYGGRFSQGDVETKVKKFLGLGVYPIIEYVDSYTKYELPQYNLEVEDKYSNVLDVIPEFTIECIEI